MNTVVELQDEDSIPYMRQYTANFPRERLKLPKRYSTVQRASFRASGLEMMLAAFPKG